MQGKQTAALTKLESLKAQEGDLKPKEAAFESEREAKIKALRVQEEDYLKKTVEHELKINENSKKLEQYKGEQTSLEEENSTMFQTIVEFRQKSSDLNNRRSVLSTQKTELTKQFNKWKDLSEKCPYCEQSVDIEFIKKQKALLTKKIILQNKAILNQDNLITEVQDKIKPLVEKSSSNTQLLNSNKLNLFRVDSELYNARVFREVSIKDLDRVHKEIASVKTGTNPYKALLEACNNQIISITSSGISIESEIKEKEKALTGVQFWSKGFKELRLWVVSEALAALEAESNTAIEQLGLYDWQLKFQMERETSKKTISKGFHVLVNSKTLQGEEYVPFEIWSGGETQRLKLGATIGLSSLIQNYKGVGFNISIWDEPTSYLSEEGIEDLIKYLDEYAKTSNKAIYMVDQRYLESPYFRKVITVEKNEEGSKIYEN